MFIRAVALVLGLSLLLPSEDELFTSIDAYIAAELELDR